MNVQRKNSNMETYIRNYENVISDEICSDIINIYEKLWKEKTEEIQSMSLCYDTKGNKTCGACNCQRLDIMQHKEFQQYTNIILQYLQSTIQRYTEDTNIIKHQWPPRYGFEHFRVKRYLPDGIQQHDLHSDVNDKSSAKRFLSIICYLNEDFSGGETTFPNFNHNSKVTTGGIIMFPCTWSYLHKGNPVKSGSGKYVLGTFLNYLTAQQLNRVGDKTLGTENV